MKRTKLLLTAVIATFVLVVISLLAPATSVARSGTAVSETERQPTAVLAPDSASLAGILGFCTPAWGSFVPAICI